MRKPLDSCGAGAALGFLLISGLIQLAGCGHEPAPSSKETSTTPVAAPATTMETLASNCPVDEFKVNGVRTKGTSQIYFAHPKSTCILPLPANTKFLRFGYGIDDGAIVASPKTGGVTFRISLQDGNNNPTLLWSRDLNPAALPTDRGTQTGMLQLAAAPGAHLLFETAPLGGPKNNWAYWTGIATDTELNPLSMLSENKLTDEFGVDGVRSMAPMGQILFAHPHSVFALPLSDQMRSIQFGYGIADGALAADPKPGGVEFRVILEDSKGQKKNLWTGSLKPVAQEADRGTHKASVDIPAGGNRLLFETVAPHQPKNEWAYWSEFSIHWAGK